MPTSRSMGGVVQKEEYPQEYEHIVTNAPIMGRDPEDRDFVEGGEVKDIDINMSEAPKYKVIPGTIAFNQYLTTFCITPSPQPTDLIHPDDERKPRHGHDPALPDDELTTDPWRTVAAATGITVPRPDDVHAVALEDALDHVLGGVGAQKDEAAGARAGHGREPGRLR
ncbi:hypothetical protein MGG_18101 [Pyricularia oryzae 70-15]|uniref:Uncharacterized protein n=3 Tax=Pyricularia oryzae TaxID=318829 RepID=Q2KES5_PYRO7|nr:uncharacterized protein MGG_18101 [Pyricularia oryzae 70-15]EAQ71554.1 hypothetical protein MGCH7_ch7g961 [Pyricularia oryzae 70-15]KYQ30444.1 hypothetical protein MGG_18101 [Pyricularia oryzae 70-15]